ncbi:hypothetical protein [Actinoallomurus acanthiterrae]
MTALVGAAAPAAYATSSGSSCVGNLVESDQLKAPSGNVLGFLSIYWDGATGENCATVTSSSIDWGVSKPMYAWISACKTDTPNTTCYGAPPGVREDPPGGFGTANYSYQAGPVSVPAVGHCIMAGGQIAYNGETAEYITPTSHC